MKKYYADDGATLPAAELAVMNGIWLANEELGRPVTTKEVIDHAPELAKLKMTTVLGRIELLCEKGFIRISKMNTGDRWNVYEVLVPHREYQSRAYREFVEKTMLGDRTELAKLILASMEPEEFSAAKEKVDFALHCQR